MATRLTKAQRKQTPRYLAMQILVSVEQDGAYVNLELSKRLDQVQLSPSDRGLLTELVYGVTQRRLTLDQLLAPYIKKKIPLWLRTILRLSAFQLLYLDRIPSYAVLNEASEITRIKAGQAVVNFVNGVLRNLIKEGDEAKQAIDNLPLTPENISLQASLPLGLVHYLNKRLSLEDLKALSLSLLEKPALSIRLDGQAATKASLLADKDFVFEESQLSPLGLRLVSGDILSSSYFKEGRVTIQDETSMLVAPAGQLQGSEKVLDACSAPGGKTSHMASYLTTGKVYALDLHAHKMALIEENAQRLGVADRVEAQVLDAREVDKAFEAESFDTIYVDAPCSGLGLMRRKPDIKYSKAVLDFKSLQGIQAEILDAVAPTLKKGGSLVYSTCTFTQEENQDNVEAFLERHPDFKLGDLSFLNLPQEAYTAEGYIEILPHYFHTDGFFIAKLIKKED